MIKHEQLAFGWATETPPQLGPSTLELERIAALALQLTEPYPPAQPIEGFVPVFNPLAAAIEKGHFGRDERGPICPTAQAVRTLTADFAELLVNLIEGFRQMEGWLANSQCSDRARLYHERDSILLRYRRALAKYADDFGQEAADRLDLFARQKAERESGLTK